MNYFLLDFDSAMMAMKKIWEEDDRASREPTAFDITSAGGERTYVICDSAEDDSRFRDALTFLGIQFREGNEQAAKDWFNSAFER
mgnify:CR=1 FL=1